MLRRRPWIRLFLVGACLGSAQCEKSEMEAMCQSFCAGLGCADFDIAHCNKQCVGREGEAKEVGDACAKANLVLIECLSALEDACVDASIWWKRRGSAFEYPCRPETEAFLVERPNLWFEDPTP